MKTATLFFKSLSNFFGLIALVFLLFLMTGTTIDVLVRKFIGRPISGVFELSELSMVLIVFFGLGWTQLDQAHIRVTVVVERLPQKVQTICHALAWFFAAVLVAILAYPATLEAIHSFGIKEFRWGYVEFPIWWAKIALAIGLWFAFLQFTFNALHALFCLSTHSRTLSEHPTQEITNGSHY